MLRFLRSGNKHTKTIWWVLIVVTVVTFVGGFVFLLGSGLSAGNNARASGAVGTVNNVPVSRTDYSNALTEQRESYKQQYGTEPTDRDLKMLEVQTWRSLVNQRLMAQAAKREGLAAADPEVVLALKTSPPTVIQNAPSFQTNGKFDYSKYQQALRDPNNNWAPFEQILRDQIPTRKLQERLLASLKMSEPELFDAYRQRFDRVDATVVQVGPEQSGPAPKVGEADLDRVFQKHRGRFVVAAQTELEVLAVPKKYGDEEVRTARELAASLVQRARNGEDFAALARDYSEGPAADRGGVIDRSFQPGDFEPTIGAKLAALPPGQVLDPFQDQSRFVIIKRMPPDSATAAGSLKIAQIVVRVRPNDVQIRDQAEHLKKMRVQAKRSGIGAIAAANGLATFTTGPYDINSMPQQLYETPEAADWGLNAKLHDVSQVFEGPDQFVIAQVVRQEQAGLPKRAGLEPRLRQLAELDARIRLVKPKADAIAQALHQGKGLEEAAGAAGLQPIKLTGVTRVQPDPRIANAPEVIGALFGAKQGQVLGPIETLGGWFFVRVDRLAPADPNGFAATKTQLMTELLERRQRLFLAAYLSELRHKSKVENLQPGASY
ncbi:MAG: hypothetical protein E6K80_02740 [Candidatus Eisenbacteria bacterium]|uniref:Periplasmic chaperone PpiD n=1 Tax=Eiseniibacteriota bacterium TaxID=2212470 RepID=A0A538U9B1_UNCEI|nr:MAG: hypothetical protein E6K80_02740 [Candidatus Eisenbacteria bacterium]